MRQFLTLPFVSITFEAENKSIKERVQLKGKMFFKYQSDALVGDWLVG